MAARKKKAAGRKTARKTAARKTASRKTGAKRKAPARKSTARKAAARPARQTAKATAKKSTKNTAKRTARKAARKPAPARRKQIVGEGDYEASRIFLAEQAGFVKKNKSRIAKMGKDAEAALEGPEGASLRAAEAEARSHARTSEEAVRAAEQEGLDRAAN